jgi:hypothetical protein
MNKIKLDCSMAQFQALHVLAQKKGRHVRVPADAFQALLRDHGKLYNFARDEVVECSSESGECK